MCVSVITELVGDRSTRVFAGDGLVDFSSVVVDHRLHQLIVGVRYTHAHGVTPIYCMNIDTQTPL